MGHGSTMSLDENAAYDALKSHDPRFDGVFFVGITSTGIYCRPICPARTPRRANCRFFPSAEAAERASFRPCLRCRPELAPGRAPVDNSHRIAHAITRRIDEGLLDDGAGLEEIATQFGITSRQLRRIVQKELGVSPMELLLTRRLLLAKQLLTETGLPVIEIAFASGFSSLRRFNDAFRTRYRLPPTHLRRHATNPPGTVPGESTSTLLLNYRAPYDWEAMLDFLGARVIRNVEFVTAESYARTVRLGPHTGWIRITNAPEKSALQVEFTHSLAPALPALLGRLRNLFDLAARPDLIAAHLMKEKVLTKSVARHPGLRVPGAFDGFEMAVRAILGQQITVKAATTLAGRFADVFGEKIVTPFSELTRLSPTAGKVAVAGVDGIGCLGIFSGRAKSILALARALDTGVLNLDAGANTNLEALVELPGVGPWTAHYIAMRALRWPDAFPKEDIALRKILGGVTAKQAEEMSQPWRPWRSYAVMHVWKTASLP
jgi:AraC family transcriptional regulator, regulatory protein of adaptative response / DNA-3-methyladenine glycosylase II